MPAIPFFNPHFVITTEFKSVKPSVTLASYPITYSTGGVIVNNRPLNKQQMEEVHPYIPDAYDKMQAGRISRREFIRMATLLGMSAGLAVACSTPEVEEAADTVNEVIDDAQEIVEDAVSGGPVRGGTFTKAMSLQLLDHPARLSWVEGANIVRHVSEYLTETGPDNITRPLLLDRWQANDDVSVWDLYLKQGIKFNNGDELTADDVMFTFSQWMDENVGSSMLGLISYWGGMENVEKVDDYHIRLNLATPNIGVPEHLFHYPGVILHRDFEGDFVQQPIGTGPYVLEEYAEGQRARFRRREDYWRDGADGEPLPYIDELIYLNQEKDAAVAALQAGQIDSFHQPRPSDWQALKDVDGINVQAASTAQVFVLRMRVDLDPWTNQDVVNALKMCQDRERILQLSFFGEGDLAMDAHVAPVHPAYADLGIPEYDPDGARALLEGAGFADGLEATLVTKNDEAEPEIAQALKQLAEPAGFTLNLDITEPGGYWDRWADVDLGITAWTHRPLDTMVLPLAYIADENGDPVPWNETRWVDEEFTSLLRQAEATLDVEARRAIMGDIQQIMQDRGPIGISYFKRVWNLSRNRVKNFPAHPTSYDFLAEAWLDDSA